MLKKVASLFSRPSDISINVHESAGPLSQANSCQRPHAGAVLANLPTREARLHWPNGERSAGIVAGQKKGKGRFTPSSISGPPANRKSVHRADPAVPLSFRTIETEPYARGSESGNVKPRLLTQSKVSIDERFLEAMAKLAGNVETRLASSDIVKFGKLLKGVLHQLEDQCDDPEAVRHAKEGLTKGQAFQFDFFMDKGGTVSRPKLSFHSDELPSRPSRWSGMIDHFEAYRACVPYEQRDDAHSLSPLLHIVHQLRNGEHLFIRSLVHNFFDGHALGISVTRMGDDLWKIGIVNPHGWDRCFGRELKLVTPLMISVSLDTDSALKKLSSLQKMEGAGNPNVHWSAAEPLFRWLATGVNRKDISLGKKTTGQKRVDCVIESHFAWLRNVLSDADYKLIKANTLNILAEKLRGETPASDAVPSDAVQNLNKRITSSLSGYLVTEPKSKAATVSS